MISKGRLATVAVSVLAVAVISVPFAGKVHRAPHAVSTFVSPLKTAGCKALASHQLPDPACTPGAINPAITVRDLCPHLSSKVVRAVSQSTKDAVRRAYADQRPGEIDHLVPLELGGSNEVANLWPEDGKIPNSKDIKVETPLHAAVCDARISLKEAQRRVASDWRTAMDGVLPQ